jgi:hypothetical protein
MIDLTHLFGGWGENGPTGLIKATPVYDFEVEKLYKTSCDTIFVNYDGTIASPVKITGHLDGISPVDPINNPNGEDHFPEWIVVNGGKGNVEVSIDQEKFQAAFRRNYNLADTLWIFEDNVVTKEVNADYHHPMQFYCYARFGTNTVATTDKHGLYVAVLPNAKENPVLFDIIGGISYQATYSGYVDISLPRTGSTMTVIREKNVWHCSYIYDGEGKSITATFDIVSGDYQNYTIQNGNLYYSKTWTEKEGSTQKTRYQKLTWVFERPYVKEEGGEIYSYTSGATSGTGTYTLIVKDGDEPEKTIKGNDVPLIRALFLEYINNHPEEFQ